MCVNDVISMEILKKGAPEVFHSTLQHFRPDSLTACVTTASQVITHSLFSYN